LNLLNDLWFLSFLFKLVTLVYFRLTLGFFLLNIGFQLVSYVFFVMIKQKVKFNLIKLELSIQFSSEFGIVNCTFVTRLKYFGKLIVLALKTGGELA